MAIQLKQLRVSLSTCICGVGWIALKSMVYALAGDKNIGTPLETLPPIYALYWGKEVKSVVTKSGCNLKECHYCCAPRAAIFGLEGFAPQPYGPL